MRGAPLRQIGRPPISSGIQFGFSAIHPWPAGILVKTNTFYAPYCPTRIVYFYTSWQANDPLVHYTIRSHRSLSIHGQRGTVPAGDIVQSFGTSNFLSPRYRPWGGNPNKASTFSETHASLTYKDPVADVADSTGCQGPFRRLGFPDEQAPERRLAGPRPSRDPLADGLPEIVPH